MTQQNKRRFTQLLFILPLALIMIISSCKSKDDTNSSVSMDDVFNQMNQEIASPNTHNHSESVEIKQGIVTEVLNTDRYTYLELQDKDQKYWIAITRQPINIGEKIVFSDGILKNNFESKEFNRLFETIYLVSRFQRFGKKANTPDERVVEKDIAETNQNESKTGNIEKLLPDGSTPINNLLSNSAEYEGKKVLVSGTVIKVNYNIMGKNWVHLRNGDKNRQDFTLTTTENVMEGESVTFEGTIHTNRDFGAGYFYDVIMEDATLRR